MFPGAYSSHWYPFVEVYYRQACGTLPSQWFKRRRGLANGLVFAGGGLGGCIQSIVMQLLIDKVGILWTFRIMGLITLCVTVPAAMLLKERYGHVHVTAKIDWYCYSSAIRTPWTYPFLGHYSRIQNSYCYPSALALRHFLYSFPLSSYQCMHLHSTFPEAWVQSFLPCSTSLLLLVVLGWVTFVMSLALSIAWLLPSS